MKPNHFDGGRGEIIMKKNYSVILTILLITIAVGVILFYHYKTDKTNLIEWGLEEAYRLSKNCTLDEAVKDGFVNVTDVSKGRNEKIDNFLLKATKGEWAVLKTVQLTDEGLLARLYVHDDRINQIRLWTYEVKRQSDISPDKRFQEDYSVKNEDGVSKVYLTNIHNKELPNWESQSLEDEVIYSFVEKKIKK